MLVLPFLLFWVCAPLRFATATRWVLGLSLAAGCTMLISAASPPSDAAPWTAVSGDRHREGVRVHATGKISQASRRWFFQSLDGEHRYVALENQALERIAKAYQDDPADCYWKITGRLTEFFDKNYLIIETAERSPQGRESAE